MKNETGIDLEYIRSLRSLSAALVMQAMEAERRRYFMLSNRLLDAASAAAAWAKSLEDTGRTT